MFNLYIHILEELLSNHAEEVSAEDLYCLVCEVCQFGVFCTSCPLLRSSTTR